MIDAIKNYIDNGGSGISKVIVNIAEDISIIQSDVLYWFQVVAVVIFMIGWHQAIHMKKPNSDISGGKVATKLFFAPVLYQLSGWMAAVKETVFLTTDVATPYGYVAQAKSAANPWAAMLLAILAIIVFVGWVYGGIGMYRLATVGGKRDKEEHVFKAIYTSLGAMLLVNVAEVVSNVVESGTGSTVSMGSF